MRCSASAWKVEFWKGYIITLLKVRPTVTMTGTGTDCKCVETLLNWDDIIFQLGQDFVNWWCELSFLLYTYGMGSWVGIPVAVNRKYNFAVLFLQILTRDSVTTQVDGVVYYRIYSAISAVANVNDVHQATYLLAQTTLRNVLGTQTLSQILSGREEIAHSIQVKHAEPVSFPLSFWWSVFNKWQ